MFSSKGSSLRVSVIVPAYNAARTLRATLGSVCAQTIADIEIIVVNDGSSDTTADILSDLTALDPRIAAIHQPNAGVAAARNRGVAAARAQAIAFLDSDDLWQPHHLEAHLEALHVDPLLDVSFSAARFIDESGMVVGAARPSFDLLDASTLLQSNPTATTSTWVLRRAAFDRVGLFETQLARSEDQDWLVRAALAGVAIRGTAASIVDYRLSTTGLASDLEGMRRGFLAMLDHLAVTHGRFVAQHRVAAIAAEDLYLARRALQLSLPRTEAYRYLRQAFAAAPLRLLTMPRATLGVLLRALLPSLPRSVSA